MGLQFCYVGDSDRRQDAFRLLLLFDAKIDKSSLDETLDRVSDTEDAVYATRERVNELNKAFIRIQRRLLGAT